MKEKLEKANADLSRIASDEESSSKRNAEVAAALELEKELRKRAESHEEEERRERTAACAQLIAMTQAHKLKEKRFVESKQKITTDFTEQIERLEAKLGEEVESTRLEQERAVTLEGEAKQLRLMLEEQRSNSQELELLAKQNGELVALKHRMAQEQQSHENVFNSKDERITELEAEIRDGESQRRALHNLVQELRGNVRVFARVRPFLPGDNVQADTPVTTFRLHHDQTGLSIIKPGEKKKRQRAAVSL